MLLRSNSCGIKKRHFESKILDNQRYERPAKFKIWKLKTKHTHTQINASLVMHKNPFLLEKQYSAAAGALHLKDFLPGVPGDTIFFFLTRSPKDALFPHFLR